MTWDRTPGMRGILVYALNATIKGVVFKFHLSRKYNKTKSHINNELFAFIYFLFQIDNLITLANAIPRNVPSILPFFLGTLPSVFSGAQSQQSQWLIRNAQLLQALLQVCNYCQRSQ